MTKEQKEEFLQYLENLKLIQADDYFREGLDIAISALSEELSEDGTLTVHVSDGSKVKRVFVMGDNIFGGLYYPDSAEKGEWIGDKDYPICSKCGTNFMDYVHYTEDAVCLKKPDFCPNCGADMRGE